MTFVLILAPSGDSWPAVITGYESREAADAAGREAVMADMTEEQWEASGYGMGSHLTPEERTMWRAYRDHPWRAFTVIPG